MRQDEPRFWRRGLVIRKPGLKVREALFGYLFVTPQILGFFTFVLGPVLAVFVYSFQHRSLLTGQVTPARIENYVQILQSDLLFRKVLSNSLVFAAGLVPTNMIFSFTLALLLTREIKGTAFFRTVFFAPVVTSAAAWVIVWKFMLQGENGTINQFLSFFGIDGPNWLFEPGWAMLSVVLTRVLKNLGTNMIIFMAAIKSLPSEYDEAAQVDGANAFQRLLYIKLPLVSPTILMVFLLTLIGSFKVFDHILLMTNGGPANATMVLVYYIYYQAFKMFQMGYASALAVVLFLISLGLTVTQWALRRRYTH